MTKLLPIVAVITLTSVGASTPNATRVGFTPIEDGGLGGKISHSFSFSKPSFSVDPSFHLSSNIFSIHSSSQSSSTHSESSSSEPSSSMQSSSSIEPSSSSPQFSSSTPQSSSTLEQSSSSSSFSFPEPEEPEDPEPQEPTTPIEEPEEEPADPSIPPEGNSDYFYCPVYGPFNIGDSDFTATFKYRANIDNQQIIERLRVFNASKGTVVSAQSHPSFAYENHAVISTSFNIPIRDYLTYDGITLRFEILNKQTREIIKSYFATFYPVRQPTFTADYYKEHTYRASSAGFYGDGQSMVSADEFFDFTPIGDYLDFDYYYRLSLDDLTSYYRSAFPLTYSSINLRFNDSENLFPYCTHDAYQNVNIPLSANIKGSLKKVKLAYKNQFYLNPRTLQIADSYSSGFQTTSDFYLPINGKKKFNDKQLYLDITGIGFSNITVTFPLRYVADRAIVGVANEDANWVSGGSK